MKVSENGWYFEDRREAGKALGQALLTLKGSDVTILGLPRGGVPVAYEVAKILEAPLDVIISRKLGAPENEELAIGAVSENGKRILDDQAAFLLGISEEEVNRITAKEMEELSRRADLYRESEDLLPLEGKRVILVDDGIATGQTMLAAIQAIRDLNPREIYVAAPVCAEETERKIKSEVDGLICLSSPLDFVAVAVWYRDFPQTSDAEVLRLLRDARQRTNLL